MKKSPFIPCLLLVFASIVLGAILSEVTIRIFLPQDLGSIVSIYQVDERLKYKYQSQRTTRQTTAEYDVIIQTNSEGMRDKEYKTKKEHNTFRILVVGDSFSFGHGVNVHQTYPKLLEKYLNTARTKSKSELVYQVINAAIGGYHPEQYYQMMKLYTDKYDIDFIIVGFYIGNDIRLFDYSSRAIIKDGFFIGYRNESIDTSKNFSQQIRDFFRPIRVFFGTKSHLYVALKKALDPLLYKLKLTTVDYSRNLDIYKNTPQEQTELAYLETSKRIKRFFQFSKAESTPIVFLLIPERVQVYEELWDKSVDAYNIKHQEVDKYNPNKRLGEVLETFGIPFLDLLPFMSKCNRRQFYFARDGHWNVAGHTLAANVLFDHFRFGHVIARNCSLDVLESQL